MRAYACILFFVGILLQLKAKNIFKYYTKIYLSGEK
ncbi:hypothetical protein ACUW92_000838 [Staphylococcus epidermidis]